MRKMRKMERAATVEVARSSQRQRDDESDDDGEDEASSGESQDSCGNKQQHL